jgi:hypothetical protein
MAQVDIRLNSLFFSIDSSFYCCYHPPTSFLTYITMMLEDEVQTPVEAPEEGAEPEEAEEVPATEEAGSEEPAAE